MSVRILGLPVAFVVIVLMAVAIMVFIGAWAADARAQARMQGFPMAVGAEAMLPGAPVPAGAPTEATQRFQVPEAEAAWWEEAFLYACPLH